MKEIVYYFQIILIEDLHISQMVEHRNRLFMNSAVHQKAGLFPFNEIH